MLRSCAASRTEEDVSCYPDWHYLTVVSTRERAHTRTRTHMRNVSQCCPCLKHTWLCRFVFAHKLSRAERSSLRLLHHIPNSRGFCVFCVLWFPLTPRRIKKPLYKRPSSFGPAASLSGPGAAGWRDCRAKQSDIPSEAARLRRAECVIYRVCAKLQAM